MSVRVHLYGGIGNKLFQYFAARIFAENNNLIMETLPNGEILSIIKIKYKTNITSSDFKTIEITDKDMCENNDIEFKGSNYTYIFNGYFQNSLYFHKYRDIVLNCIENEKMDFFDINKNDVLVYIRLGDFKFNGWNSEILHPQYYIDALNCIKNIGKIYISLWPECDNRYLDYFKDINYELLKTNDVKTDFHKCKHFQNVISSNSTLHWWALFVSNVKYIYTPKKYGFHGVDKIIERDHVKELCKINNSIIVDNIFISF